MKTITTDVVVVGAGAAGLYAAAVARGRGLEVIVVEADASVGGATARDLGHVWLPGHPYAKASSGDTPEGVATYLEAILPAPSASSSAERRAAFVAGTGEVGVQLAALGVTMAPAKGRPDTHPAAPGARLHGRVIASQPWDRRQLGPWADTVPAPEDDVDAFPRAPRGVLRLAKAVVRRIANASEPLTGGSGLVAQLLHAATRLGATLWLSSPMTDLVTREGRAVGVLVEREGERVELQANAGVILACGGFEGNPDLRREHLPLPTEVAWTTGHPGNTGVGIRAAQQVGAAVAGMNDAWWTLVALFEGRAYRMTSERSKPFSLIVDRNGDRFVNEAGPMPEIGQHFYTRQRRVRAIPSWLIVDSRHRKRYALGPLAPGSAPGRSTEDVVRAATLDALASELGIDRAGLIGTVVRLNGFAKKNSDADFGRGDSAADRANGDPTHRKNPCLGSVEEGPFWAVRLYPGDTGTKGGLVVDADARVLNGAGEPVVAGLFAVGGTAASLFPRTGPASGAALGSALVDAHRAVLTIADDGVGDPPAKG